MYWAISAVIGLVTAVLGVEVVKFVFVDWLKLYPDLSLTDSCLILLVLLQTTTLVHMVLWRRQAGEEVEHAPRPRPARPRTAQAPAGPKPPVTRRRASDADRREDDRRGPGRRGQ